MNFIEEKINKKIKDYPNYIPTFRFPPEPNSALGLHLGHLKAIVLNFGLAEKYDSTCILRFDDTNPLKESKKYVDSIIKDIEWLGYVPSNITYASDNFEYLLTVAKDFIMRDLAYVDFSSSEEIAEGKGTPTTVGKNSPYRNRSNEDNINDFEKMISGEITNAVLRLKIDMTSPNMLMRDPVVYRHIESDHHRTGDKYKVYPMYDFAHPICDLVENITDSLCTLEFEVHRPLYNWILGNIIGKNTIVPEQTEFNRLNLNYSVMSKRIFNELIENDIVEDLDDPRLPTVSGLRRRGYTPTSLINFCEKVGWTKKESVSEYNLLEACLREDLNKKANRYMVVTDPIKLTIENWDKGVEWVTVENNPEDKEAGSRTIPFSKDLYIEREDFRKEANRKYFRLKLDHEVRLKGGYVVKAIDCKEDKDGNITEVICTYDPNSKSGMELDRKVKGTIHWVSATNCVDCEIREYDRLFKEEKVNTDDLKSNLNENSLTIKKGYGEINLLEDKGLPIQFMRKGYYVLDEDTKSTCIIYNKCVSLKENW